MPRRVDAVQESAARLIARVIWKSEPTSRCSSCFQMECALPPLIFRADRKLRTRSLYVSRFVLFNSIFTAAFPAEAVNRRGKRPPLAGRLIPRFPLVTAVNVRPASVQRIWFSTSKLADHGACRSRVPPSRLDHRVDVTPHLLGFARA